MSPGAYAVTATLRRLAERVDRCTPDQQATVLDAMEQLLDWLDAREAEL